MKKHLALILAVALPFGLMGCGNDKSDSGQSTATQTSTNSSK